MKETIKRWCVSFLCLAILGTMLSVPTMAVEADETAATEPVTISRVHTSPEHGARLPENDELFAAYAEQQLYDSSFALFGSAAGARLSGDEKLIYDELVPVIQQIANGKRASAVVGIGHTVADGEGNTYYADQEVIFTGTEFTGEMQKHIIDALLADFPFEMYWYDKEIGSAAISLVSDTLIHVQISFTVSQNYQGADAYSVDTAKTGAATLVAATTNETVAKYADVSDYEKLLGYRNEICDLVSYNYEAADGGSYSLDNDPWQLIHVFDGDSSTNVVCEGYSKAFMYLCDLTAFNADVSCYAVTGVMNGEPHMWNIVTINGMNYLVDVTNSDSGMIGEGGGLFLVSGTGSAAEGYTVFDQNYVYDVNTVSLWGVDESSILTLAAEDYAAGYEVYLEGDFEFYLYEDAATVAKYHGTNTEVVIPATIKGLPVTVIGNEAFYDNDIIQTVTIPVSVQSIQDGDIKFDFDNFYHGVGAFRNCDMLEMVIIPDDSQLSYMGEWAFANSSLSSITLPSSIRELARSCFGGTKLTKLVLPEGLERVGQNAMEGTQIKLLHIPSTCTDFHCFINLDTLESISVAEGNPNYRSHEGVLYAYNTPYFSGGWGLWVYPKCKPETTYTVSDYCEYIFGDSVAGETSTPEYLQEIYIGKSKDVGSDFSQQTFSRLRCTIIPDETNPYYTSQDGMLFSKDMKTLIQVPSHLTGTVTIPEGVERIAEYAAERGSYSTVEIPDTVTSIGNAAFWYTNTLEEIYITDSVTLLGGSAFQLCENLETIRLSANIEAIYPNTFLGCSSLSYIILPERLVNIQSQAFSDCQNLRYIYIPASVTSIENGAFHMTPAHRDVFYGGTEEEWNRIAIAEYNPYLEEAEYHFETVIDLDDPLELELHTFVSEIVAPSCWNLGFTQYTCSKCGWGYTDNYVDPLDHSFTNYKQDGNASCTEDGTKTAFCDANCGASNTVIDIGSAKGHNYESIVTAPTCTAQGFTTHICGFCGDSYVESYTDMVDHNGEWKVLEEATCTENGRKVFECVNCRYYDEETIRSFGHNYESIVTAPTCTAQGFTTHICGFCGDSYVESYTDMVDHNGEWKVLEEATCTENGRKVFECVNCRYYDEETIRSFGHNYESIVTAPTCTVSGYTIYTCIVCAASYTDDFTDPTGHIGPEAASGWLFDDSQHWYGCVCGEILGTQAHIFEESDKTVCSLCGYTSELIVGDLNGDGSVDEADVALLLWHTLFPDQYILQGSGNFTGSEIVDEEDVAYLLWHTLFPDIYPLN